jgi:hypothetical protein
MILLGSFILKSIPVVNRWAPLDMMQKEEIAWILDWEEKEEKEKESKTSEENNSEKDDYIHPFDNLHATSSNTWHQYQFLWRYWESHPQPSPTPPPDQT